MVAILGFNQFDVWSICLNVLDLYFNEVSLRERHITIASKGNTNPSTHLQS